jgi:hypothetical protein
MRVIDETTKAVETGTKLALEELGLPATGAGGLLIVFWKER